MSSNNESNQNEGARGRRGSFTQQTFNNIFGRSNGTSGPSAPFPTVGPITTAAAQDQRRRMSIATVGLSGTSPNQTSPFPFGRRGSVSTANSESYDENAIDDDELGRSAPTTPFTRRMSFGAQAMRGVRGNTSPGTSGRAPAYTTNPLPSIPSGPRSARAVSLSQSRGSASVSPPNNQASMQSKPRTASDIPVSARPGEGNGFNLSEQLRSRAERASFSAQNAPPKMNVAMSRDPIHERAKSISEMAAPPTVVQAPAPAPPRPERKKPDAFQERILKGDFYMD